VDEGKSVSTLKSEHTLTVSRHDENLRLWVDLLNAFRHFKPAHVRHNDIGQDDTDFVSSLFEQFQPFRSVFGHRNSKPGFGENDAARQTNQRFVIDAQDKIPTQDVPILAHSRRERNAFGVRVVTVDLATAKLLCELSRLEWGGSGAIVGGAAAL
jgi:hypothetical protein